MSEKRPTLPSIPFYYRDFLAATMGWSPAERGAYLVLLIAQWESGPLENDIDTLATIVGTDSKCMSELWVRVGRKFRATAGGLVNERIEKDRGGILETLKNRQLGAAKSRAKLRKSNVVPFGTPDER